MVAYELSHWHIVAAFATVLAVVIGISLCSLLSCCLLVVGRKICGKHAGGVQNRVKKRNRGEGGEEGWPEGQQKDKQKGRRRSEGISFAGREHYVEGASSSENFSELVLMAGGKPVAVLLRYSV